MNRTFRIQHVNIMVDDVAAATRFYCDVLGLEAIPAPDQGFPSQFFRINDEQQIHMNQIVDRKPERAHFCIVVDDFEGVFRRMKAAAAIDVETWGRIRRIPTGTMQMFVRDPSSNLIEIASAPGVEIDPTLFDDPLFEKEVRYYPMPGAASRPRGASRA